MKLCADEVYTELQCGEFLTKILVWKQLPHFPSTCGAHYCRTVFSDHHTDIETYTLSTTALALSTGLRKYDFTAVKSALTVNVPLLGFNTLLVLLLRPLMHHL